MQRAASDTFSNFGELRVTSLIIRLSRTYVLITQITTPLTNVSFVIELTDP